MVKPLPPLFIGKQRDSKTGAWRIEHGFRYLSSEELRRFETCNDLKNLKELKADFFPLFKVEGNNESIEDYLDFCRVLQDALSIKEAIDRKAQKAPQNLNGQIEHDAEVGLVYAYKLHSKTAYYSMLKEACSKLSYFPLAPKLSRTKSNTPLLAVASDTLAGLFSFLLTLHLTDIQKLSIDGKPAIDFPLSKAASIWSMISEELRGNGRIQICQYEKCKKPFVTSGERGSKREYCCNSHKTMASRSRKQKANPAR